VGQTIVFCGLPTSPNRVWLTDDKKRARVQKV
jgi:hypothetical protein